MTTESVDRGRHQTPSNRRPAASGPSPAGELADLRDLFENAAIGINQVDGDGMILSANPAELDLLGYTADEYVGHNIAEFHVDGAAVGELLARLSRNEILHDFEARLRCKDGGIRHVMIDASALRRDGEFVHARCFTRDNTERTRLDGSLLESAAQYQDFYEHAPDMFTSIDARTGKYVSVNETFARVTGYAKDEVIGRPLFDFYHPDCADAARAAFDEFVATGDVRDVQLELLCKDGSSIPVSLSATAIRDDAGNVRYSRSMLRDTRERTRAVAEKDQALTLLDTLLTAAPVGFVVLDREMRYLRVNEAAAEVTGLPIEAHIGHTVSELFPEVESQTASFEHVLRTGEVLRDIEVRGRTPAQPGVDRCWLLSYYPVRDGERVAAVGIVFQETTDRNRADGILRRQASLLDLTHDAIIVRELRSGSIVYWNNGAEKTYGWTRRDALGKSTHSLLQTEHALGHEHVEDAIGRDGSWDGELSHVTQGGDRITVESRQVVFREGETPLVLETNRDVTDRKRVTDALRFSEERYRTLADAIPAMVTLTTPEGHVEYVSQSLLDYTGLTQEQAQAGDWTRILHADDLADHADEWVAQIMRGETLSGEVRIRRHDGVYRWHYGRIAPVRDASGNVRLHVGAHIDIDDRKQAEEDLKRTAEELERANATKDEFLGLVSHELKTPITTIYGNAQVLRIRGDLIDAASRQSALDDVVQESERLHRIIDNLLVLARLERGQEIDSEPVLVRRIATRMVDEHCQHHPYRRVNLQMIQDPTPVNGQPLYLEQVMRNLLSNAEKYSPKDQPIDCDISRDGDTVCFSVLDRGKGFSEDEAEKIFTPFYRSPSAQARASGVGIGLAVCKRLIEAQGGQMWARQREGGGADIGFSLPLAEATLDD